MIISHYFDRPIRENKYRCITQILKRTIRIMDIKSYQFNIDIALENPLNHKIHLFLLRLVISLLILVIHRIVTYF